MYTPSNNEIENKEMKKETNWTCERTLCDDGMINTFK